MKKKVNWNADTTEVKKAFTKLHIYLRRQLTTDKDRLFLAKIFDEIGMDNYYFWVTVEKNFSRLLICPRAKEFYDALQDFYKDYHGGYHNLLKGERTDEYISFTEFMERVKEEADKLQFSRI